MSHSVWPVAAPAPAAARPRIVWRRLLVSALAALLVVGSVAFARPAAVRADDEVAPTETEQVLTIADGYVGTPYRYAATGPDYFDCSGFVFRVFKKAGLIDRIGNKRRGASGYWRWFRVRGLASKSNPQPGDLMIWLDGGHVGIYVDSSNAIDATPSRGVGYRKIGRGTWSAKHFNAYLHVDLTR
jgi:cell wall-associated NlpC family hydrolase